MQATVPGRLRLICLKEVHMRILLSHSGKDRQLASQLSEFLQEQGHEILSWANSRPTRESSVLELLSEQMQTAELFIVLLGGRSSQSKIVENELLAIKMLVDTDELKYMLPIILDDAEVPIELSRYLVLKIKRKEPNFAPIVPILKHFETSNDPIANSQSKKPHSPDIRALQTAHQ